MAVECFVDAACRKPQKSEVGEAAAAVVIYKNQRKVAEYARGLGKRTNNAGEYEAVLMGLLMCAMAEGLEDPIIYSDSSVVVNQINGIWQCKSMDLLPLLLSVKHIQTEFRFRVVQVPRKFVAEADLLANQFLDKLAQTPVINKKR